MSDKSLIADESVRRPSPRRMGKNRLQQHQESASRDSIVSAARAAFSEQGYFAATVDDILTHSGVSRTTFYRHFQSKEDVLSLIAAEFSKNMQPYVDELQSGPLLTEEEVINWVSRYIKFLKKNRSIVELLRDVPTSDPSMIVFFSDGRDNRLVQLFGGERKSPLKGPNAKERIVAAQMLMIQFRSFAYYAVTGKLLHEKIAMRQMGAAIHRNLIGRSEPAKPAAEG